MKKNLKALVVGALLLTTALGSVSVNASQKTGKVSQIIAFGDSCSDNGSAYATSKAILADPKLNEGAYLKPGTVYWENRYSNGKTAVEVLAEMSDVKLTNYATGGGTSGYENYSPWMDRLGNTGVLGQIEKHKASLKGKKLDSDAMYFIFAGGNDYFKFMDYKLEGTIEQTADQVVKNIETAVRTLNASGAKKFFVSNAMDLTLVPYEITENRLETAKTFTTRVNKTLPATLKKLEKELKIDIIAFDVTKSTGKIVANPQKYGIRYIGVECQPTWPKIKPAKTNADEFLNWDEWHYTRVTHRIIGEDMYKATK